ncbi:MAG: ABC-2 family transporter protein [Candidatus Latescibacterota bacterium]|nr:ABC-2 family transporter protein [Candidatus Latescibacterota bacterium]
MLHIYRILFNTGMAVMMQYRAAMAIWLIGLTLPPIIYLVVWITVARSRGGEVGGFDPTELAAYFIATLVVNHVTFTWHMFEMGWRVRSGFFNPLLVQPLHPVHRDIVENVSYKTLTLFILVPLTAALVWHFEPVYSPQRWALVAFVFALVLAFFVRFFFEWSVALLAFWITDTSGLNNLYMFLGFFLSGRMAPLDLLPGWVQTVAYYSPFRWMLAFPTELLLGRLSEQEALYGIGAQLIWIAVGLGSMTLTWQRASARYSAVGA